MRLTDEQKAKMKAGALRARAEGKKPRKRARPTLAIIRAFCRECLGGNRWDCLVESCPLYPCHPYHGVPVPKSKRDMHDPTGLGGSASP